MGNRIGKEAFKRRVSKLLSTRDEMLKEVDKLHLKLQPGNTKTGRNCYTVSLLPVVDCGENCRECKKDCYDLRNDMIYSTVINDRAKNSAIHKADPERYWREIDLQISANYVELLRINVGGDMTDDDFGYLNLVALHNPRTRFLFFTKNYEGINRYLDNNKFESNVIPILSAWKNTEMKNPHNLPVSHVLYPDGKTTAPTYGAYYCGGNCSRCAFYEEGCWTLQKGEHVIFKAH